MYYSTMQIRPINSVIFKSISLNQEETHNTEIWLNKLNNPTTKAQAKKELFNIFDKHLKAESVKKAGKLFYKDDVLQKLYLIFVETLENIPELKTDKLLEILNNTKPDKEDIQEKYRKGTYSLDNNVNFDSKLTYIEGLTEDKVLKPLSQPSPEERNNNLKIIKEQAVILTPREQELIEQRAKGKKYKEIIETSTISINHLRLQLKKAMAKMQHKNNNLPEIYESFANDLISTLDLKIDKDAAISLLIKKPALLDQKIPTLNKNMITVMELLNIDKETCLKAVLKNPVLLIQNPKTIFKNFNTAAKLLEIDLKTYTNAAIKQPALFHSSPETVFTNIKTTAQKLGIETKTYTKAALKQPQLFYQNPETIYKNISTTAEKLGLDLKTMIKIAISQPQTFYKKPETILSRVEETAQLIGIDTATLIKKAIKQPVLLHQKPEVIAKKINIVKYYRKIQGRQSSKISYYTMPINNLYYKILAHLVKRHDHLKKAYRNDDLVKYLKSQNKIYKFTIPEDSLANEFIKCAQEFSQSKFGKQIFKFVIK